MKKILFTLLAAVATLSASAQAIAIYKNGELCTSYKNSGTDTYKAVLTKNAPGTAESVDLGLSVLWATCNVGATNPQDYGDYFAWGETTAQTLSTTDPKDYSWASYKWCNGSYNTMTKYCTSSSYGAVDNKTVLDPEDDAATANFGGSWRMPTHAEMSALVSGTYNGWTDNYNSTGVAGYIFYKKVDGKTSFSAYSISDTHIFLPAAGRRSDGSLDYDGSSGYYWSSELYSNNSYDAWYLSFLDGYVLAGSNYNRCVGRSVRAVRSKN